MMHSRFLFLLSGKSHARQNVYGLSEGRGVLVNRYLEEEKVPHLAKSREWKNNPRKHRRPETHNRWLCFSSFEHGKLQPSIWEV